ncbi:hypothetical protein [Brevundimonas nasdae]|uniref:Uncharacterized protein n=1 Tax=Brevundimonas nasdae TaxID=172043 RepID=A0ACD4VKD4_9CAUL|nr:hypothetical protein [Brevundimonas nasdae]WOB78394.1 hypothetical protein PZA08_13955 [Brevundimonas nasdae]
MRILLRFTAGLLFLATATPALAQEVTPQSEDWTFTSVPERKAVMASVGFSSGLTIAARCLDGVYDVLITGLPEASSGALSRELGIQTGDQSQPHISVWTVGTRRDAAFSRIPVLVARDLAEGGKLQVIVPSASGGPRTRYVMDVDASSTAIEQTLTACGRSLVDPRQIRADEIDGNGQDGLPDTVRWKIMPRPDFPAPVNDRSPLEGYVVLSCVADGEGRLTQCQSESEQPAGYHLGRAVERSLSRARIQLSDQAANAGLALAGRMIVFNVNFKMEP